MPEIGHIVLKDETQRTTTSSTYAAPTSGHKFLGADLDGSSDYILIVFANIGGTTTGSANIKARMYDGSALMVGSELIYQPSFTRQIDGFPYHYMTKITTAASPADYEFQIASANNSDTTYVNQFYGLALKLDDMDAADFAYDVDVSGYSSLTAATWTPTDAAVTIGNGSDDWAIWMCCHYDCSITNRHYLSVMEGSTPVDTDPTCRQALHNAASELPFGVARFLQAEASETYTAGIQIDGDGSGTCDYAAVFALKMNQFADWMGGYSNTQNDIGAVNTIDQFMGVVTTTVDDGAKDWFAYGDIYWADDGTAGRAQHRITADIDNAGESTVAGITTDATAGFEPEGNGQTMCHASFAKIENVPGNTELDIDCDGREDLSVVGNPRMRFGGVIAFTFDGPNFPSAGQTINRVLKSNTIVTDPIPGYQLTQERPANSNINLLTDAAFLYYAFARLVVENLSPTDQYIMEQNLRRDLSDVASLSDAIEVLRSVSDSIAVSDGFTKSITIGEIGTTYSKVRTDVLSVQDSFDAVFLGIVQKQTLDTIALGEAEFLTRFMNRTIPEQVAIVTDLMNFTRGRVILDSCRAVDDLSISRLRINNIAITDAFTLNDNAVPNVQYVKQRTLLDAMEVLDSDWFETGSTLQPSVRIETGIEER
jgi:hypothetical protein